MRAVLFHNPKSAKAYGKDDLLAALKLADHSVRYVSSKSPDFRRHLENVAADFVVAAGGDGTVAEVIARIGNRKLPIGVLPLGTANNIARSLGIGGEPQILVESWRFDRVISVNVARVESPRGFAPFVEAFGIGIVPAMLIRASKKEKEQGAHSLRWGRDMLRKIVRDAKRIELEIMVDGKKVDGEFVGVEALNIPYTGPGLALAPKADFSDGFLELVCFERDKRDQLSRWLEAPADAAPPAVTRRGKMITLRWRNAPHRLDDEAHEAAGEEQIVTLSCDDDPVSILESRVNLQTSSPARVETAK